MKNIPLFSSLTLVLAIFTTTVFAQPTIENLTRPDDTFIRLAKDGCECETGDCTFSASELTAYLRIETSNTMDRVVYWNDTERGQLEPTLISRSSDDKVWIVEIGYGADYNVARGDTETFLLTIRAYQSNGSYLQWNTNWELKCGPTTRSGDSGLILSEKNNIDPIKSTETSDSQATPTISVDELAQYQADFEVLRDEMVIQATILLDEAVDYVAALDFRW